MPKLYLLLLICLMGHAVKAQTAVSDTLPINTADKFELKDHIWYYEDSAKQASFANVKQHRQQGKFKLVGKVVLNKGFTKSYYWLTFNLKNVCDTAVSLYFREGSSGINRMLFYQQQKGTTTKYGPTGDHYPFHQRPVHNRAYLFPIHLKPGEAVTCYLWVDQHDQNLYLPLSLWKDTAVLKAETASISVYGFYTGIYLFAIIFNLFLWLSLKDRIHIYYLLYTACTLIFALEEEGLGFMWIYPGLPYVQDYLRTLLGLLGAALVIIIMQSFLNQTAKDGAIYWVAKTIKRICLAFAIALVPFLLLVKTSWSGKFMLYSCLLLIVLSIIVAFYSGLVKALKRYRPAILYTLAIFTLLIGVLNYAFNTLGITNFNLMKPNGVVVGSTIEIVLLAFALTQRYNYLKRAHADALKSKNDLQQQTTQRVIQSQEDERARIARDLHDDLGGTLSAVKLQVNALQSSLIANGQQEQYKLTAFLIKKACEDLRHIAFDLMPVDFKTKGLINTIDSHIAQVNQLNHTNFTFTYKGDDGYLSPTFSISAYRIVTELVNNIVKHAQANEASIKIIINNNFLHMVITDNGKGFDTQEVHAGMGIANIRSRVEFLSGEMMIKSKPTGTEVTVYLPV